ncbi:MAG: cytochrome c oxidase subunit 3 family protein [Deltaproteobacteria bacterium]|nr:cytochrome c oxidase subunit 3 family protein [Deltaproteobacteria bacterium]
MWVFICTEILMFGGLFVAYGIFRSLEPDVFTMAHHHLDRIMGAVNTVVLLFSSLTAALAVREAQLGNQKKTSLYLVITIACAAIFLVVKYFEYTHKFHDGLLPGRCFGHPWFAGSPDGHGGFSGSSTPWYMHILQGDGCFDRTMARPLQVLDLPARGNMFFGLYFMMTGLHGVHVVVGMAILTWVLWRNQKGHFSPEYFTAVEIGALYWHLVDLVWIYLFPLLYLVG